MSARASKADRSVGLLQVAEDGDASIAAIGVRRDAIKRPPDRVGRALTSAPCERAERGVRLAGTLYPSPGGVASHFAPQADLLAIQREVSSLAHHHPHIGDEGVADGSCGLGEGSGQLAGPQARGEQLDRAAVGGEDKPTVPAPVESRARWEAACRGRDGLVRH